MKAKCPQCGIVGFLEKRGNNYRIKHYKDYINFKRKYIIHPLKEEDALKLGIIHQPKSHSLGQASRQPLSNPSNSKQQRIN